MKHISRIALLAFATTAIVGCAHFPTASRTVAIPPSIESEEVLDIAADSAKAVGLPPVTKLDKANEIVEFGGFGNPELGTTGQVRIRADGQAEITIKRGSVYIPMDVEDMTQKFQTEFESRLKAAN